jgi:hypothetical protein
VTTLLAVAAGAAALAVGAVMMVRVYLRSRITAAEIERRRRATLATTGKLGDASLHEAHGHLLIYSYDVAGVTYSAAQDVSALGGRIPSGDEAIFGPALVKYDPKNPANSIVVSEEWSGFRTTSSRK